MIYKFLNNLIYYTRLYKLFSTKDKVVLLYHRVNKDEIIKNYYLKGIFVSENNFKKQMEFLSKSKRKDKVIITFDDGYKDNFDYAVPILNNYNIQAIFFITINFIDGKMFQWIDILNSYAKRNNLSIDEFRKLSIKIKSLSLNDRKNFLKSLLENIYLEDDKAMNWNDLKEIINKHIVANHTLNHPNFSNESEEVIIKEIKEAKFIIKQKLNIHDIYFAYPDGDIGKDKKFIENILKKLDYKYAFTTKRGVWKENDNVYFINRIPIYYWDDLATFVNKIHGINIEDNFTLRNILIGFLELIGVKEWLKRKLKS